MRYSLFDPLFDGRVFGEPSGGGGGGGGGGSSSSSDDDKPAKSSLTKADNTIGQVSKTGQYAGDGFEWVETTTSGGSQFLTRTYTGKGKDNGLGQDVRFGSTAQRDEKEVIAQISLNEGSAFASSPASATDIPANDIGIPTGFFPESGSYAEQVGQTDYKPTVKYIDSEPEATKTFAETFAEERDKQGDGGTFTYEGKEYTTNLAPIDTSKPLTSSIRPEPKPEPEVETGPAFDYTGVSMGELGRGAPEGTLSPGTVEYKGGVDPELEVLSALKNSSSDPVGEGLMSTGEYLMAQDYENQKTDSPAMAGTQFASAGNLSGLATDFDPLTIPLMDETVTKLDPMSAQEASFDQPSGLGLTDDDMGLPSEPVDFSQFEPKESLKDSIIKVLGGEDIISRALGISDSPLGDAQKNVSTGLVRGAGALTSGLGQTYDQLVRQDDDPLTPYDESGLYSAGQKIFDFGDEMSDAYSEMSDSYKGDQEIYKNLKSYDDVVGYGPGQVDRTLLQAAGKKPGDIVQMGADMGFDLGTAVQKTAQGAGSTAGPLVLSTVPFIGPALGIGAGQQSIVGELSTELNRFIESDPRIKNTQLYRDALAANQGDEAEAIRAIQQQARAKTQGYATGLGGGTTAAQLALLSKANPLAAIFGSGALEAGQEGYGESFSTNRILNNLMPELNLPIEKKEVLEASVPAAGAGVTVATPTGIQQLVSKGPDATTEGPAQPGGDQTPGSDQAFVPTSATAGQTATDPVGIQTEYEKAAGLQREVDGLFADPEVATDPVTSAEALIQEQLEQDTSRNNVFDARSAVSKLEAAGINLSEDQLTESIKTAQEQHTNDLIDQFRLQADEAVRENETLTDNFINNMRTQLELNTGLDATRANETANKIVSDAFNNRFFSPTGQRLYQAQLEAALEKPPMGIETAMFVRSPDAMTEGPTMGTGQTEEQLRLDLPEIVGAGITNPFADPEVTSAPEIVVSANDSYAPGDTTLADQLAELTATTPKFSPFTEEGRQGLASLGTPAKLNLSPAENVEATTSIPAVDKTTPASPTPFTPEGRKQIEAQTGPSKVNLSPAENVEGTTNIPAVEQTVVQEEQTKDETKKFLPVIEQTILPGEDDEETVEVEVDDIPETETETGATVEIDLPFVSPEVTTDSDGNNTFKCPDDSYTLVAGPDGPICKKDVKRSRMRAGRSLSPYTRLNIPEGYKGPGQKTKTVTSVETAPVSS